MFSPERFVDECKAAALEADSQRAIREVVARAVAAPQDILRAVGAPNQAGILKWHQSESLTVINVVWGPRMRFLPHDHRMWAVIGIYGGQEDNFFYRRAESGLALSGNKTMTTKDTIPLAHNAIHAVTNPLDQLTGAIHVYGGDFFNAPRREWDPETFEERPYDLARNLRRFEEANQLLRAAGRDGNTSR